MYDEPTRARASRTYLQGAGDTLAFRGVSLNRTIAGRAAAADPPRARRPLARRARARSSAASSASSATPPASSRRSPIATPTASSAGASTVRGLVALPRPRRGDGPPARARRSTPASSRCRVQRPFLVDMSDFAPRLQRASDDMPAQPAADRRRVPGRHPDPGALGARSTRTSRTTLDALDALMGDPATGYAFRAVGDTTGILHPLVRFVGPYITVCNYFNYAFAQRRRARHRARPDRHVAAHAAQPGAADGQPDRSVAGLDRRAPAGQRRGGRQRPAVQPARQPLLGGRSTSTGNADCESGQRGYMQRLATYGRPRT